MARDISSAKRGAENFCEHLGEIMLNNCSPPTSKITFCKSPTLSSRDDSGFVKIDDRETTLLIDNYVPGMKINMKDPVRD
jgi:hypothetical protein